MKSLMHIPLALALAIASAAAQEGATSITNLLIPSGGRLLSAKIQTIPLPHFGGWPWTTHVAAVYIPENGLAWAGMIEEANIVHLNDRIFGFRLTACQMDYCVVQHCASIRLHVGHIHLIFAGAGGEKIRRVGGRVAPFDF